MSLKVLESKYVHKGRLIDIKVDKVLNNSGKEGIREVVEHPGGAAVLAKTDDNKFIFVNQFRYPFGKEILELPAGKLDENEDPAVCAERELEEETGYKAKKIVKLGAVCSSPGFTDEVIHLFYADGLTEGNHNRDEGEEGMSLILLSMEEINQKLTSGELFDGKTICALQLYSVINKKK